MPKISMTFEHHEIIEFVKNMLAVQGLQPKGEIAFLPTVVNGKDESYRIVVDCEPGTFLEKCPLCSCPMRDGIPARPLAPPSSPERSVVLPLVEKTAAAPREYPVDEVAHEVQDPALVDETLGESFDPPSPGEGVSSTSVTEGHTENGDGGKDDPLRGLRGMNKQLIKEGEARMAERRKRSGGRHMAGESTRPPKPGRED
jgi:hypothetical protein